ncbi:MAG: orotate phosphoribosyltransferase [Chloroflexi bacterium 13_1_40CM_4_68_4]|nr:MAG: orotate phosphoribosyltransferase [Chloroflexi bacterium 13_1_40CM_4_68_4]
MIFSACSGEEDDIIRTMTPDEVERIFGEAGALLEGHFVLSSGRHSARYLEKFRVFEHPRLTERLCAGIAERIREPIDVVVGPTTGGVILAHEVGRQLGTRAMYAEREDGRSGRVLRRGQALDPSDRVLVVDDILSTGGAIKETLDAVRRAGATVAGVAVLVDRSGGAADLGDVPLTALWATTIETFDPASCPFCARGIAAVKPGTTPAGVAGTKGGARSA